MGSHWRIDHGCISTHAVWMRFAVWALFASTRSGCCPAADQTNGTTGLRHPASSHEATLRGQIGTPCGLREPADWGVAVAHMLGPLGAAVQPQMQNWSSPEDRNQERTWSGPPVASTGSGRGEAGPRHQGGVAAMRSFGATCPSEDPMTLRSPRA